jgi:TP901 family phage tail tape measure protein
MLKDVRHQPQNPEMVEVARRFEHIIQGFESSMQKTLQGQAEQAAKRALHDLLTTRQGNLPKEFRDIMGPGKRPPELASVSLEFLRRNLYQLLGVQSKADFQRKIEQTGMAELRQMVDRAVESVRSQFAMTQKIGQNLSPRYTEALAMRGLWSQQVGQGRNFPVVLSTSTRGAESELLAMLSRAGIDGHKLRMLASATGYDLGRGQKNPLSEAAARSALIQTAQHHYQQAGRSDMAELERVLSMLPASGRHQLIGRLKEAIVPLTRNAQTGTWDPQRVLGRFGMIGGRPSSSPTEPDIVLPLAIFGNDPNKIKGYLQSIMQVQGTSHSIDTIMRQYSQMTGTDMGSLIRWAGQTGAQRPPNMWPSGVGSRLRLDHAQRQALGKAVADLITQHGGSTGRSRAVSGARLGNIMRSLAMAGAPLYGNTPLEFLSGGQRAATGRAAVGQAIAGMGTELGTLVEAIQQGTLPIMTYAGGTFPIQQIEEILKMTRPGAQTTPTSFVRPLASLVSHGIKGFRQFHKGAGVDWFRALAKGSGIGRHVSESGALMSIPQDIWRFYEAMPGSEEAIALAAAAHSGGGTAFAKDFVESLKRITQKTAEDGGFEYDAAKVQEIQRAAEIFQSRVSEAFKSGDTQKAMNEARRAMGDFSKTMTETFGKKWGGGARGSYLNQALRLTAQKMGIPVGEGGLGGAILTPMGARFATPAALGQLSAMMMTQASGGGALGELRGLGHTALTGANFHKVYAALDPEYQALFGRRDVASHQAFALAQLRRYAKEPYQGGMSYLEAISQAQQAGQDITPIARAFEAQFGNRPFFGIGPEEFPSVGLSGKQEAAMRGIAFGGRPTGRGKPMEARTLSYVLGGNLESYLSALGPSFATESYARQWLSERSGMPLGEVRGHGEIAALMRAYGATSPEQFIPFGRFTDVMAKSTTGWFRSGQGREALRRLSEGLHGARTGELPPFVLDEAGLREWARRAGVESPERIASLFSELMPPGGAPYEMLRHLPPEFAGAGYGQADRMTGEVPGGAVPGGAVPPGGALPEGTEPLLAALRSLTDALHQHLAATNKLSALIETGGAPGAGVPRTPTGGASSRTTGGGRRGGSGGVGDSGGGGGWGRYIDVGDVNAFQSDLQGQFDQIAMSAFGGTIQSARRNLASRYGYGRFGPGVRIGNEQGYIGAEWRPDTSGVLQRTVRGDVGTASIAQAREHARALTDQFYEQIRQSIIQRQPNLSENEIRRLTMQDPRYRSMGYMGQRVATGRVGEGPGAMSVDYVETGGGVAPILRGHKAGLMTISETAKADALKLEESARLKNIRQSALQQVSSEAAAQGRAPTYREGRRAAEIAMLRQVGEEAGLVNIMGATGATERQVMRWRLGAGGRPRLAAETPGPIVYSSMREVAQEATRMTAALDKLVAAEKAAATTTEERTNIERRYIGEVGRGTMRVAGHEVPVQFTRLAGGGVVGVPQTGGTLTATAGPGAAQEIAQLLRQQALTMDRELRAVSQMPGMEGMRAMGRKYASQDVQWVTPSGAQLTKQRFNMVETPWGIRPEAEPTRLGFTRVGGDVSGAIEKVGLWAVATGAVYNYINAMKEAAGLMADFETELSTSRVLQPAYSDIDRSRRAFVDIAEEYGQSVTVVAQAAHLWERQYKDVYQVLELTRQSIKLSKVDNLDLAQANKYLEATINEMGFAAEDASRIVNSWTSVTNNAQVTMEDLADGVARAGGAARLAGVSFDELNGMIAAGVRATGAAGHEIGNMLKTVFGKMYTEQAIRQLNQVGVATHQIVRGSRELRPAQDVLHDLAERWHGLTRAQGEAIALAMAGGVRQYARLAALLNDYSTALDSARDSQDSFNAANREVSIRLDTLQGQLARLKSELQGIASSAMFEGGGLDVARGAVNLGRGITSFVGNMPAGVQANLGGAGALIANLMAMNFLFRIFGNKGFLEWDQLSGLGVAGATWPGGAAPTAMRGAGGIGRGLWSSIKGGARAGWAKAPEAFGFGEAVAPSLVGAGEAAAVGGAGRALGGLAGIAAGLGRNFGRLAAIVGIVAAALLAISWAGNKWNRLKMSPEERGWRDAQDEVLRRAPLYEAAGRISTLEGMKREGRFGVAQLIEMGDVRRTLSKQEEKLGMVSGSDPIAEAERSRRVLLDRSLEFFSRSVAAIEKGEEAPPDIYERMSEFLNYVPRDAKGMTPWMMTELMGKFGTRGLAGAEPDTKAAFMNTALGISLRRSLDAMGIPTENVPAGATLVDYLDSIKTTDKVTTGRGPAMAAWGRAAQEGALGWMFTSREGKREAPMGFLISQAYDRTGRRRYHVTGGGGEEGLTADKWFDTIEQAQTHVGQFGDSFMALVDSANAGILVFDNLWKSLDAIEKELKTMGRVSGELARMLGSIPGMFQFAGTTVGSGAAGRTATGLFTQPMAGMFGVAAYARGQADYLREMESEYLAKINEDVAALQAELPGRSKEDIITLAREQAATGETQTGFEPSRIKSRLSEVADTYDRITDLRRQYMEQERQAVESLRQAQQAIMSMQDETLELHNVWRDVTRAIGESREAAWLFYDLQKKMVSEQMAGTTMQYFGMGGGYEGRVAREQRMQEQFGQVVGQLAGATVFGQTAVARANGGAQPYGILLPGFAQGWNPAAMNEQQIWSAQQLSGQAGYTVDPSTTLNLAAQTFAGAVEVFARSVGAPQTTRGAVTTTGRLVVGGGHQGGPADRIAGYAPSKARDPILAWLHQGEYVLPANMAASMGPALERARRSGSVSQALDLRGVVGYQSGGRAALGPFMPPHRPITALEAILGETPSSPVEPYSWLPTRGQQVRPYQEPWGMSSVEMEAQIESQLAEANKYRAATLQRLRQRSAEAHLRRWQQRYPALPASSATPRYAPIRGQLALPAPFEEWAEVRQLRLPGMAGFEGVGGTSPIVPTPAAVARGGGVRQLTLPFDSPEWALEQQRLHRIAAGRLVAAEMRAKTPPLGGRATTAAEWEGWMEARGISRPATAGGVGRPPGVGRPLTGPHGPEFWAEWQTTTSREAVATAAAREAAKEVAAGKTAVGRQPLAGGALWGTVASGTAIGAFGGFASAGEELTRRRELARMRPGEFSPPSAWDVAKTYAWRGVAGAGIGALGSLGLAHGGRAIGFGTAASGAASTPFFGAPFAGGAAGVFGRMGGVGGALGGVGAGAIQYYLQQQQANVAEADRYISKKYAWRKGAHGFEAFSQSLGLQQILTGLGMGRRGATALAGGLTAGAMAATLLIPGMQGFAPMVWGSAIGGVAGRLAGLSRFDRGKGGALEIGNAVDQLPIGQSNSIAGAAPYQGTYTRSAAMRDHTRNLARAMVASQRAISEEVAKNLGNALTEFRREAPRLLMGALGPRTQLRSLGLSDFSGLGPTGAADRRYMWWGMRDMPETGLGPMARMGFTEAAINRMGMGSYIGMGGGRLAQEQSQTAQTAFRRTMDESFKQFGEWASNTLNPQVSQLGHAMLDAAMNLNKFGTGEWAALIERVPAHLRDAVQQWSAVRVAEARRLMHMSEAAEVLGTHQRAAEAITAAVGGVGPTGRFQVGEVTSAQWANIMMGRMAPGAAETPFAMQRQAAQQAQQIATSGLQSLYSQYGRGNAAAGGAIRAIQAATSGDMASYRQIMASLPAESRSAVEGVLRAGQMANWQPPRRGDVEEKVLSAAYGVGDEWMQYMMGPERYNFMMGNGVEMSPIFMGAGGRQTAMPMSYLSQWAPATASMWSGYQGWYQTSGFWGGQAGMSEMIRQPLPSTSSNMQSASGMLQSVLQTLGQIAQQDAQTSQMNLEAAKMFVAVVNRDGQQRTLMTDDFRAASRFGGQITGFDAQGKRIAGPTSVDPGEAQM